MNYNDNIIALTDSELSVINGGFFWVALPIIIAAGYTLGKDRATRDNAREENKD